MGARAGGGRLRRRARRTGSAGFRGAAVALVPLPFLVQHGAALGLTPRLVVEQKGLGPGERWTLVAKKGRVSPTWRPGRHDGDLHRRLRARGSCAGVLGAAWRLPESTRVTESAQVLSALRRVVKGEDVAVLLDGAQGDGASDASLCCRAGRAGPLGTAAGGTGDDGRQPPAVRPLGDAGEGPPGACRPIPVGPAPSTASGWCVSRRSDPAVLAAVHTLWARPETRAFLLLLGAVACAAPLRTLPPPAAGAGPEDAAALAPSRARRRGRANASPGRRPGHPTREGRRCRPALRAGGAGLGGLRLRPGAGAGGPGARAALHRHPGAED